MRILDKYDFVKVGALEPARETDGKISEFRPQDRYPNEERLPLNRYGKGPFCRFAIPSAWSGKAGVYILLVRGSPAYVGECQDLWARFNFGYGTISTRNCFRGGQETDCRINHFVLEAARRRAAVELVFLETDRRYEIEYELVERLSPAWNRTGGRMFFSDRSETPERPEPQAPSGPPDGGGG